MAAANGRSARGQCRNTPPASRRYRRTRRASRARAAPGMAQDQRHFLPRVVGAAEGRVVAVVGGDDQQILPRAGGQESGEPGIEFRQRPRIARRVAAVAVFAVEIDQVGEDQPVRRRRPRPRDASHASGIGAGRRGSVKPWPAKRSAVLPMPSPAGRPRPAHRARRAAGAWRSRAARGVRWKSPARALEGAGDDAADRQAIGMAAGDRADR